MNKISFIIDIIYKLCLLIYIIKNIREMWIINDRIDDNKEIINKLVESNYYIKEDLRKLNEKEDEKCKRRKTKI